MGKACPLEIHDICVTQHFLASNGATKKDGAHVLPTGQDKFKIIKTSFSIKIANWRAQPTQHIYTQCFVG